MIKYASRTELVAYGEHVVVRLVEGHQTDFADIDRVVGVFEEELGDAALGGYFQVIFQGTPPLHPEVRRYAAQSLDGYGDRVSSVFVLLGLGFWQSSLRLALKGFTKLIQRSGVIIEGSIEAGAYSLARELIGLNPEELKLSCLELQAHMRELEREPRA